MSRGVDTTADNAGTPPALLMHHRSRVTNVLQTCAANTPFFLPQSARPTKGRIQHAQSSTTQTLRTSKYRRRAYTRPPLPPPGPLFIARPENRTRERERERDRYIVRERHCRMDMLHLVGEKILLREELNMKTCLSYEASWWPVEPAHDITSTIQTPTTPVLASFFELAEPSQHQHLPVRREASLPPGASRAMPARSCIVSVSQLNSNARASSWWLCPECERFHSSPLGKNSAAHGRSCTNFREGGL